MLKTTKHLLALALSAAMLLGSPGMLTAFADNGDDLAMAKSLSVQTMGEDPEENPESNEITIGQSEESTPSLPPANTILQAPSSPSLETNEKEYPKEIAPGSYLLSCGLTITYRYIDQKNHESLNETELFKETVPEITTDFTSSDVDNIEEGNFIEIGTTETYDIYVPLPSQTSYSMDNTTYELYNVQGSSFCLYDSQGNKIYDEENDTYIESSGSIGLFPSELLGNELVVTFVWKDANEVEFNDQQYLENEIQDLNRSIEQNGNLVTPLSDSQPDTFLIDSKENIFLRYSPTMDMKNLIRVWDDGQRDNAWWLLILGAEQISEKSIIYLSFEFDDMIDLTQFNDEAFSKIELETPLFSLDDYEIEGQKLTFICHWIRPQNAIDSDKDSMIKLNNLILPIRSDWEGNSLTIHNDGFVKGFAYTPPTTLGNIRIDGGSKTDEFILKLPDPVTPDPTPDPEPQPEPDPEPDRPSRPNRDDDDDWEPLPDAPVKEKAETVEVETEVPEQTETQTPVQQPEKHNPETGDASFAPVSLALAAASLSAAALLARKRK